MGFRSTFTIEDYAINWPQWFMDKWGKLCWFNTDANGVFASKHEAKTYMAWEELPSDIQKAIDWDDFRLDDIVLVYLHECGGITRCQIEKDAIKWSEPDGWRKTNGVEHSYCYGCSDA